MKILICEHILRVIKVLGDTGGRNLNVEEIVNTRRLQVGASTDVLNIKLVLITSEDIVLHLGVSRCPIQIRCCKFKCGLVVQDVAVC